MHKKPNVRKLAPPQGDRTCPATQTDAPASRRVRVARECGVRIPIPHDPAWILPDPGRQVPGTLLGNGAFAPVPTMFLLIINY